jgi:predicted DNA-binding ribbon-helix-helix protein
MKATNSNKKSRFRSATVGGHRKTSMKMDHNFTLDCHPPTRPKLTCY